MPPGPSTLNVKVFYIFDFDTDNLLKKRLNEMPLLRACELQKGLWRDWKHVPWGSGSSPNHVEFQQARIEIGHGWGEMAQRCNAPNGKARDLPHRLGVSPLQDCPRNCACLVSVDQVPPGCQEKDKPVRIVRGGKKDRLCNLIEVAAHRIGGFLRGPGLSDLMDIRNDAVHFQRGKDAFHTFAHEGASSYFSITMDWLRARVQPRSFAVALPPLAGDTKP